MQNISDCKILILPYPSFPRPSSHPPDMRTGDPGAVSHNADNLSNDIFMIVLLVLLLTTPARTKRSGRYLQNDIQRNSFMAAIVTRYTCLSKTCSYHLKQNHHVLSISLWITWPDTHENKKSPGFRDHKQAHIPQNECSTPSSI